MISSREVYEHRLAAALSRHIGYTTGAFHLERITGLTSHLAGKPFRYEVEVSQRLQAEHPLGKESAEGVINFAISLGLLQRIAGDGSHSRLTLTDIGRSIYAASLRKDRDFYRFLVSYALLEYDADLYCLILEFSDQLSDDWLQAFRETVFELRKSRLEWLQRVLKLDVLVKRIAEQVPWMQDRGNKLAILDVGSDFARHHTRPRRGWARAIGHLQEDNSLSVEGRKILQRLHSDSGRYFWLGPDKETLNSMRIPLNETPRPLGPAWSILRPEAETVPPTPAFVREVGEFMIEMYPSIRLHRTNQAPVAAIKPFIYYKESTIGIRTDEEMLIRSVFEEFGETIAPLSGKGRTIGHYQLRPRV